MAALTVIFGKKQIERIQNLFIDLLRNAWLSDTDPTGFARELRLALLGYKGSIFGYRVRLKRKLSCLCGSEETAAWLESAEVCCPDIL